MNNSLNGERFDIPSLRYKNMNIQHLMVLCVFLKDILGWKAGTSYWWCRVSWVFEGLKSNNTWINDNKEIFR